MKAKLLQLSQSLAAIALIMAIGAFSAHKYYAPKLKREKALKNEAQTALHLATQQVKVFTDKKGNVFGQVQNIEASPETLKHLPDRENIESVIRDLKSLRVLINTKFEAKGQFTAPVRDTTIQTITQHDTVYQQSKTFMYSDGYLQLGCSLGDSANCLYTYNDSATVVIYSKPLGKWFQFWEWGKKQSLAEVRLSNPNAMPLHLRTITVKK